MNSVKHIFTFFVITFAVVWAGALIFAPYFFAGMSSNQRYILATIMIVYAIFRGSRVYKDLKK